MASHDPNAASATHTPSGRRCLRRHSRGRARPSAMVPCQLAPTLPRDRLSLTRAASAPQQLRCRSARICPNHTAAGPADTHQPALGRPQRRPFALLLTLPSCACSFGCDIGPRFAPSTLVLRRQPGGSRVRHLLRQPAHPHQRRPPRHACSLQPCCHGRSRIVDRSAGSLLCTDPAELVRS